MACLRRFGQRKPIVVDAAGVTIAGAGVLTAAKALGWTHVAATRHDDLAGDERLAYAIADNRSAELSAWTEALRETMAGLDPVAAAALGFDSEDLAKLAGDVEPELEHDEIPEPLPDQVSKLGDLWVLGEQRLLCGDCTNLEDVKRVMAGELAPLVATDPPYLVGYDGTNRLANKGKAEKNWSATYGQAWNEGDAENPLYSNFMRAAAMAAAHADAAWYVWYASSRHTLLERAFRESDILPHCQIIWAKSRHTANRTWYFMQHEPCLVGFKGGRLPKELEDQPMVYGFEPCLMGWKKGNKPKRIEGQPFLSTVWPIAQIPNAGDRPDHPTPKPLECYAIPMRQHTRAGDLVYEPFGGSGTAVVVAHQLGRRCRAIEISPVYCDVIVRRWQKLAGKAALLEGDGRPWAELQAVRAKHPPQSVKQSVPPAIRSGRVVKRSGKERAA